MQYRLNINSVIKVQLTARGREILKLRYAEEVINMPNVSGLNMPEPDDKGYIRLQLWHLMNLFGEEMILGNQPVCGSEIVIDESDLHEVDTHTR